MPGFEIRYTWPRIDANGSERLGTTVWKHVPNARQVAVSNENLSPDEQRMLGYAQTDFSHAGWGQVDEQRAIVILHKNKFFRLSHIEWTEGTDAWT